MRIFNQSINQSINRFNPRELAPSQPRNESGGVRPFVKVPPEIAEYLQEALHLLGYKFNKNESLLKHVKTSETVDQAISNWKSQERIRSPHFNSQTINSMLAETLESVTEAKKMIPSIQAKIQNPNEASLTKEQLEWLLSRKESVFLAVKNTHQTNNNAEKSVKAFFNNRTFSNKRNLII